MGAPATRRLCTRRASVLQDQQRSGQFPGVLCMEPAAREEPADHLRRSGRRLAGRALWHHDGACLRPGPGQTGNVTPVSSSETVHRRRWVAVSRDCRLEWASSG